MVAISVGIPSRGPALILLPTLGPELRVGDSQSLKALEPVDAAEDEDAVDQENAH